MPSVRQRGSAHIAQQMLAMLTFFGAIVIGAGWASVGPVGGSVTSNCGLQLDPNCCTAAELQLLPRIGPALADRIVVFRTESETGFRSPADLSAVTGIGPRTVERIAPYLRFDELSDNGGRR